MTPVTKCLRRCHPDDSVAVALRPLRAGEAIDLAGRMVTIAEDVEQGHKVAIAPAAPGDAVVKYGAPIGRATRAIALGEHVHSHNLATALSGEVAYGAMTAPVTDDAARSPGLANWRGYLRPGGRAATRNEIWILPTVGCVALMAEEFAREAGARHRGRIDGIHGFSHPHGCSQLGDDLAGTRAVLAALADNPNAGGVLLLGLGCESNQLDALVEAVPARSRDKLRIVRAQDAGDERARSMAAIDELVDAIAGHERQDLPASALTVGLKCGGSDGWSGLTANPLLGRFSDRMAASGGKIVLTEIPEIFGAEHDLFARATSPEVHAAAAELLNRFKRYFLDAGQPVSENPSPGNVAGGITTLEEKSLGAVQKGGRAPLVDVIDYGGSASRSGLTLLEAPGNDAVSSTALAAAGATMVLFTTGRGTPLGFPVPTVKVSSNSALAQSKAGWIDFDAGRLLDEPADAIVDEFAARLLSIASGEPTAAERAGQRAIAIWKRGVTL
jgi:altronate hydrolase